MHPHVSRWVPRRPSRHAIKIACEVVRERDFRLLSTEILDLSESGMLVRPLDLVLTGEDVILTLQAPFTRTWIDVEGTVSRVSHGRRERDRGPAIGISFLKLDAVSQALLRQQLPSVPPPLPTRRLHASKRLSLSA